MSLAFNDSERKAFRESKEGDFVRLPDGEYKATLSEVEAKIVGQNEYREKKLVLKYLVFDPVEFDGSTYMQFLSLQNKNAFGILKAVLRKFDIDPNEIELDDVEKEMAAREGWEVHFTLETTTAKNGKEYQNPRIRTVVRGDKVEPAKPLDVEDDIPFAWFVPLLTGGLAAWLMGTSLFA